MSVKISKVGLWKKKLLNLFEKFDNFSNEVNDHTRVHKFTWALLVKQQKVSSASSALTAFFFQQGFAN